MWKFLSLFRLFEERRRSEVQRICDSVTVYKDRGQQGLLIDFLWSVSFSLSQTLILIYFYPVLPEISHFQIYLDLKAAFLKILWTSLLDTKGSSDQLNSFSKIGHRRGEKKQKTDICLNASETQQDCEELLIQDSWKDRESSLNVSLAL